MSILNVEHLTHGFGDRAIFEDVSFRLLKGEHIGLVGANGEGKSTFMSIVTGKLMPDEGKVEWAKNVHAGYLDQHAVLEKGMTIRQALKSAFDPLLQKEQRMNEICDMLGTADEEEMNALMEELGTIQDELTLHDFYTIDAKVEEVARALGLLDLGLDRDVTDLSGGQRTKVLLAKLLLEKPDILLLDEPTNHLDLDAIAWLEEFLINFENTVIVVSHDRYFLNKVCTQIADIDYGKIQLYAGNYDFWYESSQLALRQQQNQKAKAEEKKKELEEFIRRFSANVAKSKQTTSRKKMLEKLNVDEIKPSSRKYPGIIFTPDREPGNQILEVSGLRAETEDGMVLFNDVNFNVEKGDKIVFLSRDPRAMTAFFEIINGNRTPQAGKFAWGVTITTAYLPLDNTDFFESDLNLVDWLSQFGEGNEVYMKGFLGRMLFSGEEVLKKVNVLSGGEKMRCMIARMQLRNANCLILDTPTNHLDLESIQAFNNNLKTYKGNVLFSSHDHEFIETVANRIIELTPNGIIDKMMEYDEYITSDHIKELRTKMYGDK